MPEEGLVPKAPKTSQGALGLIFSPAVITSCLPFLFQTPERCSSALLLLAEESSPLPTVSTSPHHPETRRSSSALLFTRLPVWVARAQLSQDNPILSAFEVWLSARVSLSD